MDITLRLQEAFQLVDLRADQYVVGLVYHIRHIKHKSHEKIHLGDADLSMLNWLLMVNRSMQQQLLQFQIHQHQNVHEYNSGSFHREYLYLL